MAHPFKEQEQTVKTILVVDDDSAVGEFIIQALKMETPHHAVLVNDGLQALEVAKTLVPDLFVLDYRLPHMNGLELYERLRTIERLKTVPTLLISASASRQELESQHVLFLEKPFGLEELLQAIQPLLTEQSE
jgi:CheY-like chemotaxis protein